MNHLVVIPTYNEALNVKAMIDELFGLYPNISILIVDDSSPDKTSEIVEKLQEKYNKLYLLVQKKKNGIATAYINGFRWGMDNGFDVFTSIDCDFSHPLSGIATAIELIDAGADIACGSRYMPSGNTEETDLFKNIISIGGNKYARFILGKEIYDWTEGFNTYTKESLERIDLSQIKIKGYVFQATMKYIAIHKGLKVKEFPINFIERTRGKSKMSYKIIFEALFQVIKLRLSK